MLYVILILLLLPQVAPAPQERAQSPGQTEVSPCAQGPLRAEIVAMREIRYSARDPELASRLHSELGMQIRVCGERIDQIVRNGNPIFTELVDDTGRSLIDENTYSEQDKTITRPPMLPAERLRIDGLLLTTRVSNSARGAALLRRARGYVRVILAKDPVTLTIDNPLQYYGGTIADQRLKDLGIEIAVVPPDQVENAPPANRCVALEYKSKGDHVQRVSFVDGWMRQVPARDIWATKIEGGLCQAYFFDTGMFNDDMQMVLEVFPTIEVIEVPLELSDVPLP